jgi:hypothetical protein
MGMTIQTQDHELLLTELAELNTGERAISDRRNELHAQIDRVYMTAPLDPAKTALLDRLEGEERSISEQRRQLHAVIDGLRGRVGQPHWHSDN